MKHQRRLKSIFNFRKNFCGSNYKIIFNYAKSVLNFHANFYGSSCKVISFQRSVFDFLRKLHGFNSRKSDKPDDIIFALVTIFNDNVVADKFFQKQKPRPSSSASLTYVSLSLCSISVEGPPNRCFLLLHLHRRPFVTKQ